MDQNPAQTVPTSAPVPEDKPASSSFYQNPIVYLFLLFAVVVGIVLGYFLFNTLPGNKGTATVVEKQTAQEVVLPTDAVRIQLCSDGRGSLYVKPSDIPIGPVYMVNSGKVIGVEYMLAKDQFLEGKSYKELDGLGAKIDHVNIGLLSQGHEGYSVPHYHVDMYMVPKSVEDSIKCPTNASSPLISATPSAN